MKQKIRTRLAAGVFAASLLAGFCVPCAAQSAAPNAHVEVWRGRVYLDSAEMAVLDKQDHMLELFSYHGTVYLPLRHAGEWMGKQADWDPETRTAALSGSTEPLRRAVEQVEGDQATAQERQAKRERGENGIEIRICPDITVTVDGAAQRFQNAKGETVYPAVYDQQVYLPVRSVGELMGMQVTFASLPGRELGTGDYIYLGSPWSDGEAEAVEDYLAQAKEPLAQLHTGILRTGDRESKAAALEARQAVAALAALDRPASGFAAYRLERIGADLERAEEALARYLEQGGPAAYFDAAWACGQLLSDGQTLWNTVRRSAPDGRWPADRTTEGTPAG